jgi:uncharacterized membrane protein YfcA
VEPVPPEVFEELVAEALDGLPDGFGFSNVVVLVLVQPWAARRRANAGRVVEHPGPLLHAGIFLASIYGGYFGAAQGVIYLSLLGLTLDDDLQRLKGVKNILADVVNGIAAI